MEYCKVLIIDDEFITRQGIKYMIEWEREGFQLVGEATNGQEGLDLVEKLVPHIVLADIVMPVIDGLEFIKIMNRRFPSVQVITISSYDKFEYVRTALINGASDYILKPTLNPEILLNVLKRSAEKIPSLNLAKQETPYTSKIEKYLIGYNDTLDTLEFKDIFKKELYRLIAIDVGTLNGVNKEDAVIIKDMMETHFLLNNKISYVPALINEAVICIVLNYSVLDEKEVMLECENLSKKVSRIYKGVFFVVSRIFMTIKDIKNYYVSDINQELSNGFYYVDKHILVVEKPYKKVALEKFSFDDFISYLSKGRYRSAIEMFEKYIFNMIDSKRESHKLKNLTKNLLYNYLVEIEKFNVDSDEIRREYFAKIDNCIDSEEYKKICNDIFQILKLNLSEKIEIEDYRILEIKEYVENHYDQQLELSDIAKQFNFSYSYLSSYFSQMSKEGFSEYLNKIRIEKASDKLTKTDMSIANISTSVGYSDHSYFCRVFKKVIGETPSNYRKRRAKK